MLKKMIALMMAAILLLTVPMEALAAGAQMTTAVTSSVVHEDGSVSNVVKRAFISTKATENITLQLGQYYRGIPFFAFDSHILSFKGAASVKTPDGSAPPVSAWVSSGGSTVGYADSSAWLEMKALQPGTATVTVSLKYPRSADGEVLYPDGTSNAELAATRTFNVTVVDGYLRMTLELNTNAAYIGLSPEFQKMIDSFAPRILGTLGFETVKSLVGLLGAGFFGQVGGLMAGVLGESIGDFLGTLLNDYIFNYLRNLCLYGAGSEDYAYNKGTVSDAFAVLRDLGAETFGETIGDVALGSSISSGLLILLKSSPFGKVASFLVGPLTSLIVLRKQIDNEWKATKPIAIAPDPIRVTVRLENIGPAGSIIDVDHVLLTSDADYLNFNSSRSVLYREIPVNSSLASGEVFTEIVTVYPEIAYRKHKYITTEAEYAYEDAINGICNYVYKMNGVELAQRATAKSPELTVFTMLDRGDIGLFKPWVNQDPEYRSCYIMCPVIVELLDENGQVLFTAVTDGEEVYADNGVIVGSNGEAKYVSFSPETPEGYTARITAVDNGTMNLFCSEKHEDGTAVYALHGEIPLVQGDVFIMTPMNVHAGSLMKLDDDETYSVIEPTLLLNEETIRESLTGTDVSDWALDAVAQAALRAVYFPLFDSFQQEITVEDFSRMLLDRYEAHTFDPAGSISEDIKASDSLTPATDIASAMKLLPALEIPPAEPAEAKDSKNNKNKTDEEEAAEPVYMEWNADAPITRGQAALAMSYLLQKMALYPIRPYQTAYPSYEWTDIVRQEGELSIILVRAINSLYGLGIMRPRSEEPLTFEPDAPLTMEEAIAAVNAVDTLCRRMKRRNDAVTALLDSFLQVGLPIQSNDSTLMFLTTDWDYKASMMPFGLRGVSADPQSLSPTLSDTISNPLSVVYNVAMAMKAEDSEGELVANTMADNICALFPENDKDNPILDSIQLYEAGHGEMFPWDGSEYAWIPFSFKDEEGGILNDEVYLYLCYTKPYLSEDTAAMFSSDMVTEAGQFIITDQDVVAEFLSAQSDLLSSYDSSVWVRNYGAPIVGSESMLVGQMQQELKDRGFYAKKVSNVYDANTEKAVRAFQKKNALEQTGIATQYMMDLLFVAPRELTRGDGGLAVRRVREALINLGYLTGKKVTVDGSYDNAAIAAMKAFQEAMGLEVTGVGDAVSQKLLLDALDPTTRLLDWLKRHP